MVFTKNGDRRESTNAGQEWLAQYTGADSPTQSCKETALEQEGPAPSRFLFREKGSRLGDYCSTSATVSACSFGSASGLASRSGLTGEGGRAGDTPLRRR